MRLQIDFVMRTIKVNTHVKQLKRDNIQQKNALKTRNYEQTGNRKA